MPHCIIEYSEPLRKNIDEIIGSVHAGAMDSGLFDEEDIKSRAIPYKDYQIGTSKKQFVHVSAKILAGRSIENKTDLSKKILSRLNGLSLGQCSLTVEVIDIEKESYAKINNQK